MTQNFKPSGYNSLSPYFIVADSKRWIELLKTIFDTKELRRYDNPDGSLMHAEIQIDDSVIMLSEASEVYPANIFLIHVYVPDALQTYEKALSAGCEGIEAPVNKEGDPDIRGQFRDFAGNIWAIGTQNNQV
ncbi:MAG: VOC family protein [Cyclobacteriaceae bacterium]